MHLRGCRRQTKREQQERQTGSQQQCFSRTSLKMHFSRLQKCVLDNLSEKNSLQSCVKVGGGGGGLRTGRANRLPGPMRAAHRAGRKCGGGRVNDVSRAIRCGGRARDEARGEGGWVGAVFLTGKQPPKLRKGGWGWGRAKNWQQRLPPMHSPQGWRKCGGGRLTTCRAAGAEELGGKGGGWNKHDRQTGSQQ